MRPIIFLYLIISTTITTTTTQTCPSIIQLGPQSTLDTEPIEEGAYTCIYRCHSSSEGNAYIETVGVHSMFTIESCSYYGECQTFSKEGPDFDLFTNGQYYYSQNILHSAETNIFAVTCTFTASENGFVVHNESFVRYLTRNLPVLIPEATEFTVNVEDHFSTVFTIFLDTASESVDIDNFMFHKGLENSYFEIQPDSTYMQLQHTIRTVIQTNANTLVIASFAIQTQSISASHIGRYEYSYALLTLYSGFTLSIFGEEYCGVEYQYGLVWPGLIHGAIWNQTCSNLGDFFSSEGFVSLSCGLDLSIKSECSIIVNTPVIQIILLPNLNFLIHNINDIILQLRSFTLFPIEYFRSKNVFDSVLQTEFTYISVITNDEDILVEIEDYFVQNMDTLKYHLLNIQAFMPSETCYCDFDTADNYPSQENIFEICEYRSCDCFTNSSCSCLHGYIGTNKECGIDTDFDGYPDHLLNCVSDQNNAFCTQDNCPTESNTDQIDCDLNGKGDACDGPICPYNQDMYGIVWPCGVGNGVLETNTCFGGVGIAYRECGFNGEWLDTDISQCASVIYGSALTLCNSNPGVSIITEILENITGGILGQIFPYGNPDVEAYYNLFSCLSSRASSHIEFTRTPSNVELFLKTADKIIRKFIDLNSRFIEEVIIDLARFSKYIQLSNNVTISTDAFTLYTTRLLSPNQNDFIFSRNGTEIFIPGPLIQETCSNCVGVSVNIIIMELDMTLKRVVTTDNLLMRPNRLSLNYFEEPEIITDIVSVEFGDVSGTSFVNSYSIKFNTYEHSFYPFQLTEAPSPVFCARYSNQLSLWVNNIDNDIINCNSIQSAGIFAEFTGFRHLEDTIRPLNMVIYIGTFASLLMYSTTILLYIFFFRLLVKISHLINLVLALLFVCYDVLFIFTLESTTSSDIACKTASIFMHYFLSATFIWLTTYTLVCYILISFPHYRFKKKSFVVIFVFATLFTLVVVLPFTPFYHEDYISNSTHTVDSLDERFAFCWVNTRNIIESYFIFLVSAPIVILYFASIIIISLTLMKDLVSTFGLKSSKKLSRVLLIYIILFGLNWASLLAFLSTNNAILAYVSAVLNAIQAIFFLFGVVLIPHQEVHQRIEYYTDRKFCKNIRIPKVSFPKSQRKRAVTQAELAIRAQHDPIIEMSSKGSIEGSATDILSGSVDFSKLLKGEKVSEVESEIDIMDPSTFAPAVNTGKEPAPPRRPSRLKVLPEVDSASDITQSSDSKQQELAIYYPISISSRSTSQVNTETLAEQIDATTEQLLDVVVKAESGEMVDQSDLFVQNPVKFAAILNSDSFDEQTPPSTRASMKPNPILAFWEKKIKQLNREANKLAPKPRDRLSIPTYIYADQDLEDQYFRREPTRMMLPSGRMVTATPPPSDTDEENCASSMPELIYLQSRSFSPEMFDRLRRQASNELREMDSSLVSTSYTVRESDENEEHSRTSVDSTGDIENELVADLDTLVNQIDINTAKSVVQ